MFYTPTFTYSNDKSVNCSLAEWRTETPLFWGYIFLIFSVIFWFRSIGKRERNIYSLLWNVEITSKKWVGQSVKDIKKTTLISLNRNLAMMSTIGWYNIITAQITSGFKRTIFGMIYTSSWMKKWKSFNFVMKTNLGDLKFYIIVYLC